MWNATKPCGPGVPVSTGHAIKTTADVSMIYAYVFNTSLILRLCKWEWIGGEGMRHHSDVACVT